MNIGLHACIDITEVLKNKNQFFKSFESDFTHV